MSALCQKQTLTDRLEKLPELLLGSCNQISGIASSARRAAARLASVEFPIQAAPNRVKIGPAKTCCK
jgi:hypothetical protein